MRYIVMLALMGACDGPGSTAGNADAAETSVSSGDVDNAGEALGGDTDGAQAPDATTPGDASGGDGGPVVRTGLEGNCDRYVACGGTYYDSAQACIDATLDYWEACRRPELDAFGDCMTALSCSDWGDPDGYNPADTPCADEWADLQSADCP